MPAPLLLVLALAAPPSLLLAPPAARPGDAVLVSVLDPSGSATPRGTLAGRGLTFWRDAGGAWRALTALPIETVPGEVSADVTAGGATLRARLEVVDPRFPSRTLTLPDRFVRPPRKVQRRIRADRAAFSLAYDRPFGPPRFDRFAWPRDATRTGRFGDRRLVNGKQASVHYGVDLDGATGAPVASAADGVVVLARDCYLSGKSVLVSHGAGVYTQYFHLSRLEVKVGDEVRLGDRLGGVGMTGRATGPHLHWGAKVDGLLVDPESLVAIDFRSGSAPPRGPRPPPEPPADAPVGVETAPLTTGEPAPPR